MKRLAIFAKPPVPGSVKTRLSPALPVGYACQVYRAMLEDALDAAARASADERFLYWSDSGNDVEGFDAAAVESRTQRGADLGERLSHAFAELLRAPDDRAVILGADCPALDAPTIDSAFTALESADLVLGPTRDGGYYLIGLRKLVPDLFSGIAWSTDRVAIQTLERARDAKLTTVTLGQLEDLDTPEDLVRMLEPAARGRLHAKNTLEALRAIGLLPPNTAWW